MRTGPFAQDNVIRLLNNYYVPYYVADEDFAGSGKLTPDEKAEIRRIVGEAHEAKMRVGDVCVYITGPDGKILDGLKVPQLYTPPQNTIDLLQRNIDKLKVKEGKPLVKPTPQSVPPKVEADVLVLHVAAREDNQKQGWQGYPAENWLTFPKAEWSKFLPPASAKSYEVDAGVAKKLLTHFYPGTEDTHSDQVDRNVIETATIRAKVLSSSQIQLEGTLKMARPFYPGHPEHQPVPVEATVLGLMEVDGARIKGFKMATEKASFGKKGFGAAAWTVKEKANESIRPAADSRDSR
jgi:hypothetical protein